MRRPLGPPRPQARQLEEQSKALSQLIGTLKQEIQSIEAQQQQLMAQQVRSALRCWGAAAQVGRRPSSSWLQQQRLMAQQARFRCSGSHDWRCCTAGRQATRMARA